MLYLPFSGAQALEVFISNSCSNSSHPTTSGLLRVSESNAVNESSKHSSLHRLHSQYMALCKNLHSLGTGIRGQTLGTAFMWDFK